MFQNIQTNVKKAFGIGLGVLLLGSMDDRVVGTLFFGTLLAGLVYHVGFWPVAKIVVGSFAVIVAVGVAFAVLAVATGALTLAAARVFGWDTEVA